MSRRTKLLITAIFLVLLAIPVVYITLSWSPQEPWRTRIAEVQDEQGGERKKLVVEVENMSSVPLCIYMAVLEGPAGPPHTSFPPSLEPLGATTPSPPELDVPNILKVSPHQVQRFHISVPVAEWQKMPESAWEVGLLWASGTKHRTLTGLWWLQRHLPSSWEEYVPLPSMGESTLPLDAVESTSQAATQHP